MKHPLVAGAAVVIVAGVAVGLWAFQPWKLWVDDKIDQAAPTGARELVVTPTTTSVDTDMPATTPAPPTTATSTNAAAARPASPIASTPPPTPSPPPTSAPPTPPTTAAPAGTQFIGIDHGTSGTLLLLQDDAGRRFVRIENLDTSNGPDLFVYLSANSFDGEEGVFDDDYVNLGRLQGNIGSQNYEIPADVDPSRYASVVIWCDRFNSAFGAAPLA
jgi:hypothetical protein